MEFDHYPGIQRDSRGTGNDRIGREFEKLAGFHQDWDSRWIPPGILVIPGHSWHSCLESGGQCKDLSNSDTFEGTDLEKFRTKEHDVCIVGDTGSVVCAAGEGIGLAHALSWLVMEGEVEAG